METSLLNFPMIFLEMKYVYDDIDYSSSLLEYIRLKYQDNPIEYIKDVNELNEMRKNAVSASRDSMGLNMLKKYLMEIRTLKNRFPLITVESDIKFSWVNLYDETTYSSEDIRFEESCILYNIGVLYMYLGSQDSRKTDNDIKECCNYYQYAAWCFQTIINLQVDYDYDLCHNFLLFAINLSLAQAQECVFKKSIIDKRKSSVIAKVCSQIYRYYELALSHIDKKEKLNSRMMKDWIQLCQLKMCFYKATTYYYNSISLFEANKFGESLGNLYKSKSYIDECLKMKMASTEMKFNEAIKGFLGYLNEKINGQQRENDFVYHEKVTDLKAIDEVDAANLVKIVQPTFQDTGHLFTRLIPIEIVELSSLYTLETSKLSKSIGDAVEMKNSDLEKFLSAIKGDIENNKQLDDINLIPDKLLECCASLNLRRGLVDDIPKMMKELIDVSLETKDSINDLEDLIEQAGELLKGKDIKERVENLKSDLNEAESSNVSLHVAFKTILDNLKILVLPLQQLQEKIPKIELDKQSGDNIEQLKQQFEKLLGKINEMKEQREQLMSRLKKNIADDNIIQLIIGQKDNHKELFEKELKKHDELCEYLRLNLNAQETILRTISDVNAQLAHKRRELLDMMQERQEFIKSLITSYENVDNICLKCKNGVEFFNKMKNTANQLNKELQTTLKEKQVIKQRPNEAQAYFKKPIINDQINQQIDPIVHERPKLKDFLPFMKQSTDSINRYQPPQPSIDQYQSIEQKYKPQSIIDHQEQFLLPNEQSYMYQRPIETQNPNQMLIGQPYQQPVYQMQNDNTYTPQQMDYLANKTQQVNISYRPQMPQVPQFNPQYSQIQQPTFNYIPPTNNIEFKKPTAIQPQTTKNQNNQQYTNQTSASTTTTTDPRSVYRPGFFKKPPY